MVTISIILLTVFTLYIEGFDRVIVVTESRDDIIDQDETVTRVMRSGRNSCCVYGNCSCQSLFSALANLTSNVLINITTDVELSSIIQRVNLANVTITGHNNPTVNCNNSGGLHFISCSNCTIEGITWIRCGSRIISDDENAYPVLQLTNSSNIIIQHCSFQHSVGQAVVLSGVSGNVDINGCHFLHNKQYEGHGTAIHYSSNTNYKLIVSPLNITVSNCNFSYNERAKSIVYFGKPSTTHCDLLNLSASVFFHNKGVPVYLSYQDLFINGNVKFHNNFAENGGGIFVGDYSSVIFHKSGIVEFINNTSHTNGGAIFLTTHSSMLFKGYSKPYQCDDHNELHSISNDQILAKSPTTCTVKFHNNTANWLGQDIYVHNSRIIVDEDAEVIFDGNAFKNLYVVYSYSSAVYIHHDSTFTFKGDSMVTFSNNAKLFKYGSTGEFLYINNSTITFEGHSKVAFNGNKANYGVSIGGAVYTNNDSTISFGGNSTVTFNDNYAQYGGAMYVDISKIVFKGNSKVIFNNSKAFSSGGVMNIEGSFITFEENSVVTFSKGWSNDGGAVYMSESVIKLKGNSTVRFYDNVAYHGGGAVHIVLRSKIVCEENSMITFNNNNVEAKDGGAVYISDNLSEFIFKGNCVATFNKNSAAKNGGTMYIGLYASIIFEDNSIVTFNMSEAYNSGGALYIYKSTARCKGHSTIMFNSNTATLGGSLFSKYSSISIEGNAFVNFTDNAALQNGGAIYLSDHSKFLHSNNSSITFYLNTAKDYGRDIYALINKSSINFSSSGILFKHNTTLGTTHESIYIKVPKSCNSSCLFHNVNIANKNYFQIATSPHKLMLYNPGKCIIDNSTDCDAYYMSNVMLGEKITFDACVLDYYDQPTKATQFLIKGMNHEDYNISGSDYITISCNHTTQGITLIGNLYSNNSYNYSLTILLYVTHVYESKIISVNLTVEISQCHAGFWYSNESQKCECYDTGNIISCSDSNSTIKRGYWFGYVNGKSTVTSCPNNYCDFSCCEITNGIYHLSPVRANQCRSHRSGTACGNCKEGYTLSFDSPECVEAIKCTTGQMILVIMLSLLYWIAIVVTVFAMMYFKVMIGSLYAIIYYYSVVDILLSQVLLISNELYTTVNIMSSFAKLTPQFLGQLCLVQNMSGIDQQFIHYVHPIVISFILIMISIIAKRSHRVSLFISRGIIHFICFLLLLSYTSAATTSLLLMRPLMFMDVDKVYTYLSPDIEYFHGRHLVYTIVAILLMIVIVIGFPFLLLFEPCLNSKINFVKIKPLLDQFQGCYKDRYRWFAGYYMICRLVIILLVIVKISDDFITHYLLISSCTLMALIHVLVRPYVSTIHNVLMG